MSRREGGEPHSALSASIRRVCVSCQCLLMFLVPFLYPIRAPPSSSSTIATLVPPRLKHRFKATDLLFLEHYKSARFALQVQPQCAVGIMVGLNDASKYSWAPLHSSLTPRLALFRVLAAFPLITPRLTSSHTLVTPLTPPRLASLHTGAAPVPAPGRAHARGSAAALQRGRE